MAAHTKHYLGVSSDAVSRRTSAPNLPLMVVVTDVDGDMPGSGGDTTARQIKQDSSDLPSPVSTHYLTTWYIKNVYSKKEDYEWFGKRGRFT